MLYIVHHMYVTRKAASVKARIDVAGLIVDLGAVCRFIAAQSRTGLVTAISAITDVIIDL